MLLEASIMKGRGWATAYHAFPVLIGEGSHRPRRFLQHAVKYVESIFFLKGKDDYYIQLDKAFTLNRF